jgi:hypothetical protein
MGDAGLMNSWRGWLGFVVSGIDTVGDGLTCWSVNLVEFLEVMVGAKLPVLAKRYHFSGLWLEFWVRIVFVPMGC